MLIGQGAQRLLWLMDKAQLITRVRKRGTYGLFMPQTDGEKNAVSIAPRKPKAGIEAIFESEQALATLLDKWDQAEKDPTLYAAVCQSCDELIDTLESLLERGNPRKALLNRIVDVGCSLGPTLLMVLAARGDMRGIARLRRLMVRYPDRVPITRRAFLNSQSYYAIGQLALAMPQARPGITEKELEPWLVELLLLWNYPRDPFPRRSRVTRLLWLMDKCELVVRKKAHNTYSLYPVSQ